MMIKTKFDMLNKIVELKQSKGMLTPSVAAGTWVNMYLDTMTKPEIKAEFDTLFSYDSNIGQYFPTGVI